MNEKISVIVPVYNVERYIEKCAESLAAQTYSNVEIIFVDDGSTDRSGEMCDEFARKYNNFTVIHQKNQGAATAKNTGMKRAKGEFIFFADSDDYLAENALDTLYNAHKKYGADCIVGTCVHIIDDGKNLREKAPEKKFGDYVCCKTPEDAIEYALFHGTAQWNRLYTKRAVDGIAFPDGRIHDDSVFTPQVYGRCNKIVFLPDVTYYYRERANSITTSAYSLKQVDWYYNRVFILDYIKENFPALTAAAEYKVIRALVYNYVNFIRLRPTAELRREREIFHSAIKKMRTAALKNKYCELYVKIAMVVFSIL